MIKKFKPADGLCGGFIINKQNSYHKTLYMADLMIALIRDTENSEERYVKVIKNRNGKNGKADPQQTIELCSRLIAMSIFGDTSLKLFRLELEEEIKKTIMKKIGDAHDPFHRKSSEHGS